MPSKIEFLPFFMLFLILFGGKTAAQNGRVLSRELEKANYYAGVDTSKVTGWIIGCIDHDSVWVFGYGETVKGNGTKPTEKTIFEIGGVTKAFVGSLVAQYVQQGKLKMDLPINQYLPNDLHFPLGDTFTIQHLLTHTSGLPKMPTAFGLDEQDKDQPFETYTRTQLSDFLKELSENDVKTGEYLYSHLNHSILEWVIEHQIGRNDLAALSMTDATDPLSIKSPAAFAQGYNPAKKPVENYRFGETFRFSIGVKTHMERLLQLVQQHLGLREAALFDVLKTTQKPLFPTRVDKRTSVGTAWHIFEDKKHPDICIQTGSTNGQSAFVAFVPQTKTGVIVLANARLAQAELGMSVLKMLNYNWKRK